MLESALEQVFRQAVRKAGGIPVKVVATVAGVPDRYVLWPGGRVELVELKTETGKLRPVQRVWHARAAKLGHRVTVLYGPLQVRVWAQRRLRRYKGDEQR